MARIGSKKNPAVLRVRTFERAEEVAAHCAAYGIEYILGVEPDKTEDISDLERALHPPEPLRARPKAGRNEPCPCGSGKKAKKCCPELTV